jgi:hypothetical protein
MAATVRSVAAKRGADKHQPNGRDQPRPPGSQPPEASQDEPITLRAKRRVTLFHDLLAGDANRWD